MPDSRRPWPLDALTRALAPLLPAVRVEVVPTIDSTNTELMRRARAGDDTPTLLVAEVQSAGRGRLGRTWVGTGAGGPIPLKPALTFSLGMPLAPREWSGLSLAVGTSVANSLHPALRIKWPNDLWLDGRKLGGILIETVAVADRRHVVVGIGINITAPDATGLSVAPAALDELLPDCDAPAALLRIVPGLVRAIQLFEAQALIPFLEAFKARDLLYGREVALSDGASGVAQGVDAGGGLQVHTSTGMKTITSAEVSVRPADPASDRAWRLPSR
jgi:BirA family biotin operon repressor/biotin-[acetyl-CoA-carboxylase] ligase